LRYCRSRFSHFYFSCKKNQELSQARITKVVGIFTTNPTKLSLHFYDFSMIFYTIYKNQTNALYYFRFVFAIGTPEVSDSHEYGPGLRKSPWKETGARNWVPRHGRRRLWPKSGEVGVGGERVEEASWLT
jgi:hypothetical protein